MYRLKRASFLIPRVKNVLHHRQSRTLYKAPVRDIRFLMESMDFRKHYDSLKTQNTDTLTPETIDYLIDEFAKFAENDLEPLDPISDKQGSKLIKPNHVKTPDGFKQAYDTFTEGGWTGLSFPEEYGGQGLPSSLALIQTEMTSTACWTWTMFPGLTKGAINSLLVHANKEIKDKYLENLISGKWTGTMCLTEPACGSDLNLVTTKATPIENSDKYKISGTKIFISCGEHDLTDNIIHLVLARLPGAPEGTKGISLFVVPKYQIGEKDINGVNIGRIEDKMGCHGSPTCEIVFEDAVGELVGEPNKGMKGMFTYINTSRLGTAIHGLAAAEKSYQQALEYALERRAMRALNKKQQAPNHSADLIIKHPAVRQMLLFQKCISEGGRAMILECSLMDDRRNELNNLGKHDEAKVVEERLGFMTPILKGFLTETGLEAANMGVQIWGGHGYIKSNAQEQIVRDVRIASIWEGTTQIQALDLIARKVMLQKMKPLSEHCRFLFKEVSSLKQISFKKKMIMYKAIIDLPIVTMKIATKAATTKNFNGVGIASQPYLMYCGYLQMALHMLKMESTARVKMIVEKEEKFLHSKVKMSDFYFENVFPRIQTLKTQMTASEKSVMSFKDDEFAFNDK